MAENLLEKLKNYGASDWYPLHMPGHKRQIRHLEDPFSIDITEIEGFDNLFHAEEILKEAQERAAQLYGAEESWYLVNGSTCGILTAVTACVPRGGRILMSRNCHKAVYHALLLNGLHADYLYPPADMVRGMNGSISPEAVREGLEKRKGSEKISAVLITSPTYDGVVSDIRAIAEEVHKAGAVLIVDEAHGAHFAMHDGFPRSALACGADLVINSLHKTLPSLTQTALLHVQGPFVDRERIKKYLGVFQSSSPSYVLMAGMDACICQMLRERRTMYDRFLKRLEEMRRTLGQMKAFHLVTGHEPELAAFDYDPSKVIISTENSSLSGPELAGLLRTKYHLEVEMAAEHYVTAIMTAADTEEGFARLTEALLELEASQAEAAGSEAAETVPYSRRRKGILYHRTEEAMSITEADERPKERILLEDSAGCISGEFVYLYPPGIPLLVPGERIPEGMPEELCYYREIGLQVQGLADFEGTYIFTVREQP